MTVKEMKAVDIRSVNRDDLVDIWDVVIDQDAPKEERASFLFWGYFRIKRMCYNGLSYKSSN